jgi:hypothetical protein
MASFCSRCSSAWETSCTGPGVEEDREPSGRITRYTYLFSFWIGWKTPQAMPRWSPSRYHEVTPRSGRRGRLAAQMHVLCALKLQLTTSALKKRGGACARERGRGTENCPGRWGGGSPEVSGILINSGTPEACSLALFCSWDHFHALSVPFR